MIDFFIYYWYPVGFLTLICALSHEWKNGLRGKFTLSDVIFTLIASCAGWVLAIGMIIYVLMNTDAVFFKKSKHDK